MAKYSEDFTPQEMIVVAGSRTLIDNKVGVPILAGCKQPETFPFFNVIFKF
jgi:hypothetical protein